MIQSISLSLVLGILAFVAFIASYPNGLLQTLLLAILARFQRNIPAEQYARLQSLAVDIVAGVHQIGTSQGWDNAARKNEAVTALQAALKAHGITRFDEQVVSTIVEKTYADLKPSLPQSVQGAVEATVRGLEYNDVKAAA